MKLITVNDLENGDQVFQRNLFNWKDINTYMSPVIYFGINMWAWILKRPTCPANHVGTLYNIAGVWYVFEAKMKFQSTLLVTKLQNTDIVSLYVKRYSLNSIQKYNMLQKAHELIGTGYDYMSILKQIYRQLFDLKVDLETNPRKFKNKKVNCSESNAMQLECANIRFNNPKNISPFDLWFDDRSFVVGYLLLRIEK